MRPAPELQPRSNLSSMSSAGSVLSSRQCGATMMFRAAMARRSSRSGTRCSVRSPSSFQPLPSMGERTLLWWSTIRRRQRTPKRSSQRSRDGASMEAQGAPMQDEHGGGAELMRFSSDGGDIAFIDAKPRGRADIPFPATTPRGPDRNEPILLIHGFASSYRMNWVGPRWVDTLTQAGRRVIAFDNRGHGQSQKLHAPADYHFDLMIRDAANLLAHLGVERADVMGYSMGARIASFLALAEPPLVRSLILGGLGDRLVRDAGLPEAIAEALEAP